jgi:hypothetical protein
LAGLLIGLVLGLPILGWLVWPVQWTDAAPQHLRSDLQVDYLRMVIDSYKQNEDEGLAVQRWNDMGIAAPSALKALAAKPGTTDPNDIEQLALLVEAPIPAIQEDSIVPDTKNKAVEPAESDTEATTEDLILPGETPEPASSGLFSTSSLPILLGVMCALTLGVGGVLAFLLLRRKNAGQNVVEETESEAYTGEDMEYVQEEASPGVTNASMKTQARTDTEEPPVVQFMTTYMLGDDLYDDSFSIDAPTGEFLGECGVGISETIGVGDPKKVTAFEVWLFDKNDIQTVTKVLMSTHAFNDPNVRQRLLAKGEPQIVEPGKRILLETASLQMEARIVDASYGGGAMPTNSYFDRLTLELAVWPKA